MLEIGSSWSIGGDYTFDELLSLPNILREYNPDLKGYSTKSSVIFLAGQNSSHNGLNVGKLRQIFKSYFSNNKFEAKSGDKSYHMIDQIQILRQRLISNEFCDMENDWKIITFFVGVIFY
jgi:phospholipase B1